MDQGYPAEESLQLMPMCAGRALASPSGATCTACWCSRLPSSGITPVDAHVCWQGSGFSFWSYLYNVLVFEGAGVLPFHWGAKCSALRDRLVLGGDFHTLAHAQKVGRTAMDLEGACTEGGAHGYGFRRCILITWGTWLWI